jgi:uracil-DNA glycosylase
MSTPLKRKLPGSVPASTVKKQKQNSITSFFAAPSSSSPIGTTAAAGEAATPVPSTLAAAAAAGDDANPVSPAAATTTTATPPVSAPAPTPAPAPAPARAQFDKEKWASSLPAATRELLKLEIETLHESWLAVLREEVTSASFLDLKRFLAKERGIGKKIFPPEKDIYSW